jgi:hypothetical protein
MRRSLKTMNEFNSNNKYRNTMNWKIFWMKEFYIEGMKG